MTSAILRRIEKLETLQGRATRPSVAFVIWERTREAALAALERALAAGSVKRGDPIVLGTIASPAPLPAMRWTDALSMSDAELEAVASLPGANTLQGDPRKMTDAELSEAIISSIARPA